MTPSTGFLLASTEEAAVMPAGTVHFSLVCSAGRGVLRQHVRGPISWGGHPKRIGPAVWQGAASDWMCVPLYLVLGPFGAVDVSPRRSTKPIWWNFRPFSFRPSRSGNGTEVIAAVGILHRLGLPDVGECNRRWSAALMNIVLDYGWIRPFRLARPGRAAGPPWRRSRSWPCSAWMDRRLRYRQPYQLGSGGVSNSPCSAGPLRYAHQLGGCCGFTVFLLLVGTLGPGAMGGHHLQREHFGLCADGWVWRGRARIVGLYLPLGPTWPPCRVDLVVDGRGLHGRHGGRLRARRCPTCSCWVMPPAPRRYLPLCHGPARPAPLRGGLLPVRRPQRGLRRRSERREPASSCSPRS